MSDESINPVAQHDPDDSAKFLVEAYKECFREKRHYDILSWTLLAGIGLLSRPLFEAIIAVEGSGQLEIALRMGLSLGVCFILFIYWRIYERNRFWGEVCNETARQIERRMKLEGPSIACMKGALKRQIVLQNTDENASPVADI